jgi:AraC-like DNA-binding protein
LLTIFPQELCPEFQAIFKFKVPACPVIENAAANSVILPAFQQILNISTQQSPYGPAILKGYFLIMLGELFQMITFQDAKAADSSTLKNLINFCLENYHKDMSLDLIAEALHVSKYYLSHLFATKLNMRLNDYIAMLRVSEACKLLANADQGITDIAYQVGFNSPRSFNRAFLKQVGLTPRAYRHQAGS